MIVTKLENFSKEGKFWKHLWKNNRKNIGKCLGKRLPYHRKIKENKQQMSRGLQKHI